MRLKLSTNKHNQIYVPVDIQKVLNLPDKGQKMVEGVADTRTILLMPEGMTPIEALDSLQVIKAHLEHEAKIVKKRKTRR